MALAVHMVGRQGCITRPRGHCDGLLVNTCNIDTVAVVAAYAAHIADIVTQQRQQKMHPIAWGDPAFTNMFASEDFLANESDHEGMLDIVIESITIGDVFEGHASGPGNDPWLGGFEYPVHTAILLL